MLSGGGIARLNANAKAEKVQGMKPQTTTLNIGEPNPFFAYSDEWCFFKWLQRIKAVKRVRGTPQGLLVEINDPIDDGSLRDLIALLTRYSMDTRCLAALSNPKNEAWFKKPSKFWFRGVFGIKRRGGKHKRRT